MAKPKKQKEQVEVRVPQAPVFHSAGSPWNRIPGWINLLLQSRFWPTKKKKKPTLQVAHEATTLNLYVTKRCPYLCQICYGHTPTELLHPPIRLPGKDMDLNTFQYIMEQLPTVQEIILTGKGDPLLNRDVIRMVHYAYEYNRAETTLFTTGLYLPEHMDAILKSPLKLLVIQINGHKPSVFSGITGSNANHFITIRDNISRLLVRRKQLENSTLKIELLMTVDTTLVDQINDMIHFAESLGVDGIQFENYLPPDHQKNHQTLYRNNLRVQEILNNRISSQHKIRIQLPTLLEADMSQARQCKDPYTTVTVDGECNVSACSRLQLYYGRMGKIWDGDFWNNDKYQWLRGIHIAGSHFEIPIPCQFCTKNVQTPPRILNPYIEKEKK